MIFCCVLNEDFVGLSLYFRFSEEANPSQKYAPRVVVVVLLLSNVYYEGLTKFEQLDGAAPPAVNTPLSNLHIELKPTETGAADPRRHERVLVVRFLRGL